MGGFGCVECVGAVIKGNQRGIHVSGSGDRKMMLSLTKKGNIAERSDLGGRVSSDSILTHSSAVAQTVKNLPAMQATWF